jgi:hypothetical protein
MVIFCRQTFPNQTPRGDETWQISCSFGIFFPHFGMLYPEKSGNPAEL